MGSAVSLSELYHFRINGERLSLYKRVGESYEHVLMKALGFALFRPQHPALQVERAIGLRYKPDLIAIDERGAIDFWGECGQVSVRKIAWLARHSGARRIAFFKMGISAAPLITQLRREIAARYRPASRLVLISFNQSVISEVSEEISCVPADWYRQFDI
jgi:uncharacterized protein YaeQ